MLEIVEGGVLATLVVCAVQLQKIGVLLLGCLYELQTARWEAGKRLALKQRHQSPPPFRGQVEDLAQ
jgi:hypothetical protein